MSHWIDPSRRGIYDHPAAPPPIPQHHHSNDLASRIARMEEHTNFAAWDRRRIETESRHRAADLAQAINALASRVGPVEAAQQSHRQARKLARTWRLQAISYVRYAIAVAMLLSLLTGNVSIDRVKLVLAALGFPTG